MFLALVLALLAAATPHLSMATSASVSEARRGSTVRLFVDVIPDPKVHVYAPGAKDYLPIALAITPRPGYNAPSALVSAAILSGLWAPSRSKTASVQPAKG